MHFVYVFSLNIYIYVSLVYILLCLFFSFPESVFLTWGIFPGLILTSNLCIRYHLIPLNEIYAMTLSFSLYNEVLHNDKLTYPQNINCDKINGQTLIDYSWDKFSM